MPGFLLLHVPWGLIGFPGNRHDLPDGDARLNTERTIAPLLFSYDDQNVFLNGRTDTLELFADIGTRLGEHQKIFDLPVPLQAQEPQHLRHETWRSGISFHWAHGVDRPANRGGIDVGDEQKPGGPAYGFVLAVLARMQDFVVALAEGKDPWNFVLERWLYPNVARDPTMDIIVRHAQTHREHWANIAEHPRRVLNRLRELVPLSRVQELDVQCMQWLSRQPGGTLAERAGGRQRIMALSRFENRNTLENRVFRDLLDRTVGAAREYLTLNFDSSSTTRFALVKQYSRESRRLSSEVMEQGVARLTEPFQPNYVLLHDDRYRQVWTARQEIIGRERVMDDLWRWQRRSWAEFCKAALVLALMALTRTHLVAASPVFVRGEHRRGEWLLHDDPLAVIAHEENGWVVEILGGNSRDVPQKMRELGASIWVRFADFAGGNYTYLAVWAVHSIRSNVSLAELVESANEAFHFLHDTAMLAGGIVLQSTLDPTADMGTLAAAHVTGFTFGPWDTQLPAALGALGDELSALINPAQ